MFVLLRVSGFFFIIYKYISGDISAYWIFKSQNIRIGIGHKNSISVGLYRKRIAIYFTEHSLHDGELDTSLAYGNYGQKNNLTLCLFTIYLLRGS